MNLTTEVNNQVIIFHDGSKLFVTDNQAETVMKMSGTITKGIQINGNYYTFSSISKIISTQEYYNQYPDQMPDYRPEVKMNDQPPEYKTIEQQIEADKNRFKGVLRGLKEEIDKKISQGQKPLKAIKFYEEKLEKYKKLFKDQHDQMVKELAKEFNGEVVNA